jgi:8-oxo-dGTP pyrophosphatase MutT (NUDIX family)
MMTGISVVSIAHLHIRFVPRPWPFAEERRTEIDAHFATLKRGKPALFNGRVMLLHEFEQADATIRGACLETDYASMLAWRDWEFPDRSMRNFFGSGALRAADGAFVLVVMGAHTANAGQIYFPTGSPDPNDVFGDVVDLDRSVLRELGEETGLGARDVTVLPGWHAVFAGQRIALMKSLRVDAPAREVRERILGHMAREAVPELADIRIVRGPADLDPRMPPFVTAFLQHQWAVKP